MIKIKHGSTCTQICKLKVNGKHWLNTWTYIWVYVCLKTTSLHMTNTWGDSETLFRSLPYDSDGSLLCTEDGPRQHLYQFCLNKQYSFYVSFCEFPFFVQMISNVLQLLLFCFLQCLCKRFAFSLFCSSAVLSELGIQESFEGSDEVPGLKEKMKIMCSMKCIRMNVY